MTDNNKKIRRKRIMRRAHQAAKYLGEHRKVPKRTMYRMIKKGLLFSDRPSPHKTSVCVGFVEKDSSSKEEKNIECLKSLGEIDCRLCSAFTR